MMPGASKSNSHGCIRQLKLTAIIFLIEGNGWILDCRWLQPTVQRNSFEQGL
jgi:hypothetical protein